MNWIEAAESALKSLKSSTKVPFDFERMNCDEKQLPDTYITYFLVANPGTAWANGKERILTPRIQVSLFYRKKKAFIDLPPKIIQAFVSNGFMRSGEGRIPYQQNTGHYGWRCDFYYYEKR